MLYQLIQPMALIVIGCLKSRPLSLNVFDHSPGYENPGRLEAQANREDSVQLLPVI